jgi:nicotinamide mononucleotide adenylyltransferase
MTDEKVGIFPGRLQPLHNCHLETILHIRRGRPVIVVIGSTQSGYTYHDPLTYKERLDMVSETLMETGVLQVTGIRDFYNGPKWTTAILEATGLKANGAIVYSRNDWTLGVCFDANIETEVHDEVPGLNGTAIRRRIGQGREWKPFVPRKVADWLTNNALRVDPDPNFPGAEELDGLSGAERMRKLYIKEVESMKASAGT